jgi:hypothetical protein
VGALETVTVAEIVDRMGCGLSTGVYLIRFRRVPRLNRLLRHSQEGFGGRPFPQDELLHMELKLT